MLGWRDVTLPYQPLLAFATKRWAITLLQVVAIAPALVVDLAMRGPALAGLFVAVLVTVLFWEALFAVARHSDLTAHGLSTAMLVTLFLPLEIAAWQPVLAVSLGAVLAELVFGGRGFGFVSATAASLVLLAVSFPTVILHPIDVVVALACVVGLIALLLAGLVSWRVLLSTLIACAGAMAMFGPSATDGAAMIAALAVGLVFLITDPMAAATTNAGRWVYGALAGFLVAVFSGFSTSEITPENIVFAALLASLFAPLIDHLVVLANSARRQRWKAKHHG